MSVKYEYVHIGNKRIEKGQYLDIFNNPDNKFKPFGGFWASPFNNVTGSISDWTDIILENYEKFLHFNHTTGCLFNIDTSSKIYNLETNSDINNIKNNYYCKGYIDFEQISKEHDAIFLNPTSSIKKYIPTWGCRTLLIFNMDIITQTLPIEFLFKIGKSFNITNYGTPSTINDLPTNFYQNKYLIYQLFIENLKKHDYENSSNKIRILETIKKELIDYFKKCLKEEDFHIIEAIIINQCTHQKKLIRKDSF